MNHLRGARVYLSGPMDFVASRANIVEVLPGTAPNQPRLRLKG